MLEPVCTIARGMPGYVRNVVVCKPQHQHKVEACFFFSISSNSAIIAAVPRAIKHSVQGLTANAGEVVACNPNQRLNPEQSPTAPSQFFIEFIGALRQLSDAEQGQSGK